LKSPRVVVLESTASSQQATTLNKFISLGLKGYLENSDKVERFDKFRPHVSVCRFTPESHTDSTTPRSLEDFALPKDLLPLKHRIESLSLIESRGNAGPDSYSSLLDIELDKS